MNDLDRAIADASHAYAVALFDDSLKAKQACVEALHRVLAALDAARGQAVAEVCAGQYVDKYIEGVDALSVGTKLYTAPPAALAVPTGWRVVWFTGSYKRGSERWEIYDPEDNGGAVDKGDIRDDMVWGLLDALAAANKENNRE